MVSPVDRWIGRRDIGEPRKVDYGRSPATIVASAGMASKHFAQALSHEADKCRA